MRHGPLSSDAFCHESPLRLLPPPIGRFAAFLLFVAATATPLACAAMPPPQAAASMPRIVGPVAQTAATAAPILVLSSLDSSVSVIDPTTWAEKQRITTGKEPHHLSMTRHEQSVTVANSSGDSLTFLDPRTA